MKEKEQVRDYEQEYQNLDFTNDFLFCKIMSNNLELCRKVLEVILNISIREVKLSESQKAIDLTSDGRGVRLDVYVNDENNTVYDLEMQRKNHSDLPKRTRYYRGMIDLDMIEKGSKFSELRKTIILFICLSDPFTKGLYRYTFVNRCEEDKSIVLGDESEIVFLNAEGCNGDVSEDLKAFLGFLKSGEVTTDLCREIDTAVDMAKEHKEWRVQYMTLMMRDKENREIGREEGRELTIMEFVSDGTITLEEGAEKMNCSTKKLVQLMEENGFKIPACC